MAESIEQAFTKSKLLWVSLTKQTTKVMDLPSDLFTHYIGGRGLGTKLVYDHVTPAIAPLAPENLLIFAIGPLTATAAPTGGRFSVSTKSPLTGTIFDSNCGME